MKLRRACERRKIILREGDIVDDSPEIPTMPTAERGYLNFYLKSMIFYEVTVA